MTYLFHNSSLPFGESCVTSEFIVDKLHLDFDPAFSLFSIGWWSLFRLNVCIIIVVVGSIAIIVVIVVLLVVIIVHQGRISAICIKKVTKFRRMMIIMAASQGGKFVTRRSKRHGICAQHCWEWALGVQMVLHDSNQFQFWADREVWRNTHKVSKYIKTTYAESQKQFYVQK